MNINRLAIVAVGGTLVLGSVVTGCGRGNSAAGTLTKSGAAATNKLSDLNTTNFAETMQNYATGVVRPTPWAGYWFPYGEGGISVAGAKYDQVYVDQLKARGIDTSHYQSVRDWELYNHIAGVPNFEPWFGHCNGWSASAIMVPQPTEPKVIDGMMFDVSDQKALLAESWLEFSGDFVGTRVNDKGDFSSAAFWDVVPAQFHLLLANIVGKENHALIIDRHTGNEIWNQPLVAYRFDPVKPEDYLGPDPKHPDLFRVNVHARIWWASDNVEAHEISPEFSMSALGDELYDHFFPGRDLKYELWLDAPVEFDASGNITKSGNILVTHENGQYLGGLWKNGVTGPALVNTHPDYMWVPYAVQHSSGYKNPRIDDNWVRDNIEAPISRN